MYSGCGLSHCDHPLQDRALISAERYIRHCHRNSICRLSVLCNVDVPYSESWTFLHYLCMAVGSGPVLAGPIIFKVSMIVGLTVLRQLLRFIPTKIHKTVAIRAAAFGSDMHQIVCRLGLCPRPHWGSLQRSPKPLAGLRGPTSKGREGKGKKGEGRGPTSKGRWGEGGERGERKGMAGPIPNPLLRVCFVTHCSLTVWLGCEENSTKIFATISPGFAMYKGVWKMAMFDQYLALCWQR